MPAFTVGQPDSGAVKATQRQVWASADYRRVASLGMIMSELLCEALDLRAGQRVLDVGGGSGNAAIAAARRNTDVLCTALTTQLLEHAQARADAEGLPMQTQMADAEHLPFPDASFEVVVSAAGAMFAPQQEQAASELARVCRSDGKIGLANWTPDGFTGQMFGVRARHVPPPPGVPSPLRWGTGEGLHALFGATMANIRIERSSLCFMYLSPDHVVDFYRQNSDPTVRAFGLLDPAGQEALRDHLVDLVRRFNDVDDGTAAWNSDYLEFVASRV